MNLKIRWINDEKKTVFADLDEALRILEDKNKFIQIQMEDIQSLIEQIESTKILITQKIEEIRYLRSEIKICDDEIKRLLEEIENLNRIIADLEEKINIKNDELQDLNQLYNEKIAYIKMLEIKLGWETSNYRAIKGDLVDELLANFLNLANCPIPIRRLGEGFYMFGTRKIFAKIINGKLVIRVGGGYMIIEKFIETYAEQEIEKLKRIADKQGLSDWRQLDFN